MDFNELSKIKKPSANDWAGALEYIEKLENTQLFSYDVENIDTISKQCMASTEIEKNEGLLPEIVFKHMFEHNLHKLELIDLYVCIFEFFAYYLKNGYLTLVPTGEENEGEICISDTGAAFWKSGNNVVELSGDEVEI
jgi:hypothetical protein